MYFSWALLPHGENQTPNSAEMIGSSKALARSCGQIQTHLEEQMILAWVYQGWWHL